MVKTSKSKDEPVVKKEKTEGGVAVKEKGNSRTETSQTGSTDAKVKRMSAGSKPMDWGQGTR
jgi:hypothetical protein